MNQFKRARVVLLPTDNRSHIIYDTRYNELQYHNLDKNNDDYQDKTIKTFHHLYIISDDEIKDKDWVYMTIRNCIKQVHSHNTDKTFIATDGTIIFYEDCRKLISATDTSLTIKGEVAGIGSWYNPLPQPSQQFLEKYIESYNKGEVITDVLVEYEADLSTITKVDYGLQHWDYKLRVNSKDNTITIKKLKDSWNRKEIIEVLNKLNNSLNIGSDLTLEQWIEENL